jgi:hypothetical protein
MHTSFRLVKPIVNTICRVDRLVARDHRWRIRNKLLQDANVWDAKDPKRLLKRLMSFLVR